MNATARVDANGATLWVGTQAPEDTRDAVAALLRFGPEQVSVHELPSGGGFGRRLETDVVMEAVRIARELPGRTVQLLWPREVDMRAGYYRPAAAARVQMALGRDGLPTALRADMAQPSLVEHSSLRNGPPSAVDWTAEMGWRGQAYAMPQMHLTWTRVDPGVPCGYWRSVGASQNTFFFEVAIDVAARAAGHDPLAYRLAMTEAQPAVQAVLRTLAERAGWNHTRPVGHHIGMAVAVTHGAITGHMVEVIVTQPGRFALHRITTVVDAGVVGDPLAVRAQVMGGTVFGLTAALFGEITLEDGRVQQGRFSEYPLLRLGQLPPLDVHVLPSQRAAAGVGEEGTPTIGPAVANALFAASGVPVTRLPLPQAGWKLESKD